MSDQYIEIAPNYASTSRLAQTISSAMGEARKLTLHNAQYVEKVPELILNDSMLDRLNYLRYPQNIKPLVSPVNTPEELVRNAIAQIPYRQQLGSFYTKDTLGFINLIEQIQSGDMKHALATVMDYETINRAIDEAIAESVKEGIHGKASTPYLLAKVKDITGGDSLASNIRLVFNNAALAAKTAAAYCKL